MKKARSKMYDVIVSGGGPAGSVMSWKLAKSGMKVLLLERDKFPREKVCGDFVEPRGLRVLEMMGCLDKIKRSDRLPIDQVSIYLRSVLEYSGKIPFYGNHNDLQSHGYIISRYEFDKLLIDEASKAGVEIIEGISVKSVEFTENKVIVNVQSNSGAEKFEAELIVGADGVHSTVARSAGMLADDSRYTAVSQRCYVEGLASDLGESAFFFDEELFPGYGWMFPMPRGRANIGIGILSECRNRYDIKVSELLKQFLHKLKSSHPLCGKIKVSSPPIGGIVKTYGGRKKNYFDRGILVGDAGCFVDPMTGEGITAAMESSLIGASVLIKALEQGSFDAGTLSEYEKNFRSYFDPSLLYVDLVACIMRNRDFSRIWLDNVTKGCRLAKADDEFLKVTGATFGGMEIYPTQIAMQVWEKTVKEFNPIYNLVNGNIGEFTSSLFDLAFMQFTSLSSLSKDPVWYAQWCSDIANKWISLTASISILNKDSRAIGLAV